MLIGEHWGNFMKIYLSILTISLFLHLNSASAALFDRGNGLIYDDALGITWLQDANYAKTSGYDADGRMSWQDAMYWAEELTYADMTEWELPKVVNPIYGAGQSSSQLGHMFYSNLQNEANAFPIETQFVDAGTNSLSEFNNVRTAGGGFYWTQDVRAQILEPWAFGMHNGIQGTLNPNYEFYAWAVHEGDIGSDPTTVSGVPIPGTIYLFTCALLGLITARK